ncbi:MAG: PAS domain S-box protein, partial [Methylotenera sp.]|nr:PAS domain S-box protein [Methylotenera sp.]
MNATQSHIEIGTPYDVEYRIETISQGQRWMRSAGEVERDATGKPVFMRGIAQDIQLRKLAELALQKSENTLSEVLKNVDSYIYLKDIQGRYLYANAKVCELFDTTLDAIVGLGDEQFFDEETTKKIHVIDRQVLLEGKTIRAEETNLTIKNRVPTTYLSVKLPLCNDAGEIYALCGISTEITDIKLLENQLLKNNSLLQSTLESTNDAVLVVDLNNTWMLYNQKFIDMWQIKDNVIFDKDDNAALSSVLVQLVDPESFLSKVRELYSAPEASSFDTLKFKDGRIVERYSIPQLADGKVVGRVWSFRDVTERKLSEHMLQKSEARLASLFSNMTNGFALHEVVRDSSGKVVDYRFLEINSAFEKMTGIPREQWIGQRVKEVLPSIEEDFWIDSYAQVVNTGEPATFEKHSHEIDRWFRVYAYRPSAEHFAVIVEDITERKLAEEKLTKSEGFSRAIIEASPVPFALNDDNGNITYLNEAFVKTFGYNLSDIPTLAAWWPLAYPDPEYRQQITDNWGKNLQEAQHTKMPFEALEINIQCKDGSQRTTICNAANLEGDFSGVHLISLVDITERKSLVEALTESELRWKFALEGAGDGIWDWNPSTDEAHFSKRWKEVIGYSEHEFPNVGAAWVAHLHPDDKEHVLSNIGGYLAGEIPNYVCEFRMRCKDDSYVWILARGLVVSRDVNGAATRIVGTHHDITSSKNKEIELTKKQAELTAFQAQLLTQNENLLKLQIILQEARDRYIDLYEFAPIGYLAISNHGIISEINWKATGLFGLHRNELNGRRFEEFIVDDEKQRWKRMFSSMRNLISGEDENFDLKITHKNGSILDVNLTCLRMDDASDEPMLRISIVNVSQLKVIESKLISSEAYLRNIIDNEPEGIKIVDAKGILKQVNPSALAMLEAKTFEQAASIPLTDFIVPRDKKAFLDLHKRVITGEKMQLQYEIIGLKGTRRWVETNAVPISENGVKLVLAVTRDITQQKLAEQQNKILLAEQAAMLDSKLVGIIKVRDRKIIWSNIAFELTLGYSHEELIGMPTRQLYLNEENYQAVGASYAEIKMHNVVRSQYEFVRKDGQHVWLNLSGAMLNEELGESIWTFVDVTRQKQAEMATASAHNLLEIIIDKTPARIFWKDKDLRYLGCNTTFANDAGKTSAIDIIGKNDFELSWAAQAEFYQADDRAVMASGVAKIGYEEPQTTPQGGTIWLRTSKIPLSNNQNEVFGILGMYEDISERKLAEKELSIAATAFESQEGMLVTDTNNMIVKVNQAFSAITGYSAEDAIGQSPSLLSSGRHDADFYKAMWKGIKDTGTWQGEVWNMRKSGEVYPQQLCITAVKDHLGVVSNYVATLTDITMNKAAAEEIQRLAFYDPLTHLPNRRLLVDRLNQAIVASARNGVGGAVLFMDLDHFKTLNDSLGHDIGDLLLQQVAERLISCVREGDTVSRLGGDEFVVMLEHLSAQALEAAAQAEGVAEKILTALNKSFNLAGHEYQNTASIGIALFNDQSQSQEDLLKHADIAMYQAKKTGRNTLCFFDPKMQDAIRARVSLENDLRKALKRKEFQLHYQIQVNGAGQAIGAEALIRWIHPTRGLVSPYHFIPLAEET